MRQGKGGQGRRDKGVLQGRGRTCLDHSVLTVDDLEIAC